MMRRLAPLVLVVVWLAGITPAASAGTTLLKDIDPTVDTRSGSASMDAWATAGGFAYFTQADNAHGTELWKSNGTPGGTQLVKDITPGNRSSEIAVMVAVGARIFFFANDGTHGRELWVSDGTEAGTRLVKDVQPGTGNGTPDYDLVAYGAGVAFAGNDGTSGSEPWVSDGTADGTRLLKDVNTTPGTGSAPDNLFVDGTSLYFAADDGTRGNEPWVSDGTAAGTRIVADVNPSGGSAAGDFVRAGSSVLFSAVKTSYRGIFEITSSAPGYAEWTTGASGEPEMFGGGGGGSLVPLGGLVLYVCNSSGSGVELCDIAGPSTAELFAEIAAGAASSQPLDLTVVGSRIYFIANSGTPNDQLFTATSSTIPVPVSGITYDTGRSQAWTIQPLGGDLLFSVPDADGYELWKASGAAATKVKDILPGAGDSVPGGTSGGQSVVLGSQVLFGADDGSSGYELWKTDGTTGGTQLVRDIGSQPMGGDPQRMTTVGSQIFFTATDPTNGRELWVTDATSGGTRLVKDIRPGAQSSGIFDLVSIGSTLYFIANDGTNGRELWKSDGTEAGTTIVRNLNPTGDGVSTAFLFGDRLLLSADDGTGDGVELWVTDGTAAGTTLLKSIRSGSLGSFPGPFRQAGNKVYFAASDGVNGNELWVTDGTPAGTQLAADVRVGAAGSSPAQLTALGSTVVFVATPSSGGLKLLAWDGSTLTTLGLPTGMTLSGGLTAVGGRVYFVASDNANGAELWVTDGTPGGTQLLRDISPDSSSSYPEALAAVGSRLVFVADDGRSGRELWVTDGTTGGTQLLRDVLPGANSSNAGLLGIAGGFAYYSADDGEHGVEVWKTDGTPAGTVLAADAWDGPSDSNPNGPVAALGDGVVFGATLPGVGSEPVVLRPDETIIPISGPAPSALSLALPKSGKLNLKKGTITLKVAAPAAGTLRIANGSTSKRKPKNYVRPSTTKASGKGTLTITLKPTATAVKLLKKARKGKRPGSLKVTIKATFTAASGQVLTDTRTYTLKLR